MELSGKLVVGSRVLARYAHGQQHYPGIVPLQAIMVSPIQDDYSNKSRLCQHDERMKFKISKPCAMWYIRNINFTKEDN